MADMSLCVSADCPSRLDCYRFRARPGAHQSYANFVPDERGRCDWFTRIHHADSLDGTPTHANLTNAQAKGIREAHYNEGVPMAVLARKYRVKETVISRLCRGLTYLDASGPVEKHSVRGLRRIKLRPLVQEIEDRYAKGDITRAELAAQYSARLGIPISPRTVGSIVDHEAYWPKDKLRRLRFRRNGKTVEVKQRQPSPPTGD